MISLATRILICGLFLFAAGFATAGPLDRLDADRYGPGTLIAAIEELARYSPPQAVEPLLELVGHPDRDVARSVGWLLRRMGQGSQGAAAAGNVLADAEAEVEERISAAVCLGQLRHADGQAPLASALANDADESVRAAAARSLGELFRPGSASALAQAASTDESAAVRVAAILALSKVPDSDASAIVSALQDSDPLVRRQAAWSLALPRFRDATGLIGNLLRVLQSDADCRIQAAAAWALGMIGDPSTSDALEAAQDGGCRLTAQAASRAIEMIK